MNKFSQEVDPLIETSPQKRSTKLAVLKVAMMAALAVMASVGLTQTALGVVMATNRSTCTTIRTHATTITPVNSTHHITTHNPITSGVLAIIGGSFDFTLAMLAVVLLCCCKTWVKGFSRGWCFGGIIAVLVLYLIYTVSCIIILLLHNCREVVPKLSLVMAIINLPLGTVAITMGPYLIYCLLLSKSTKSAVYNTNASHQYI